VGVRVTPNCDSINSVVISAATGIQWAADVAFGGGNYMVIWSDARAGSGYQIYTARVSPAGSVLDPSGVQIGPATATYQYFPSIVYDGTRFFSVWGYYLSPYAVTGRFINANGTPYGDTIQLATASAYVYGTRLAYSGSNFLVSWMEYGGANLLKGLIVSASGTPVGSPFTIADTVMYMSSGLRWDGGKYLVTYCRSSSGYYQVFGRYYNVSGSPVGAPFNISNTPYNCYYADFVPGNGRFLNLWSEYRSTYDIYGNVDVQIDIDEGANCSRQTNLKLRSSIVQNSIEVIGADDRQVRIYDRTGRLLGSTGNGHFDCSDLESGIYFVKAATGEQFKVIKVK
jgi:hypothetical protein